MKEPLVDHWSANESRGFLAVLDESMQRGDDPVQVKHWAMERILALARLGVAYKEAAERE